MQTTVRLPDELYRQLKRAAVESGRTVTAFIEDAVRVALARETDPAAARERYRVQPFHGTGTQPGVDLADSAALLEIMDRAG